MAEAMEPQMEVWMVVLMETSWAHCLDWSLVLWKVCEMELKMVRGMAACLAFGWAELMAHWMGWHWETPDQMVQQTQMELMMGKARGECLDRKMAPMMADELDSGWAGRKAYWKVSYWANCSNWVNH